MRSRTYYTPYSLTHEIRYLKVGPGVSKKCCIWKGRFAVWEHNYCGVNDIRIRGENWRITPLHWFNEGYPHKFTKKPLITDNRIWMNEIDSLSEMIDDDTGVTHYRLTCVGGSVNVVDTIIRFNTKKWDSDSSKNNLYRTIIYVSI